ncbi:MAG: hypothetical protein IPN33_25310 [Saprospiraceae bacterium]|nr:hypothetical protein [Saprospiraceae bacterium]
MKWMDNHQASIWLKTSLHRILPAGPLYCYLDTDVVAIRPGVDDIFQRYVAPITFCTDHCRLKAFSPTAVHDEKYDRLLAKQELQSDLYYKFRQEDEAQLRAAGEHVGRINLLKNIFHKKRPLHTFSLKSLLNQPIKLIVALFQKIGFKIIQLISLINNKINLNI